MNKSLIENSEELVGKNELTASNKKALLWVHFILKPFYRRFWILLGVPLAWAIGLSLSSYVMQIMVHIISAHKPMRQLCMYMVIFIVIRLVLLGFYRLYDWGISIQMIPQLRNNIVSDFLNRVFSKKYEYFQNNPSGNLVAKINDLKRNVPNLIEVLTQELFGNTLALLLAIFTLTCVQPIFGWLMAAWAASVITISWFSAKYFIQLSHRWSECNARLTGKMVDILSNILSVRLFSKLKTEDEMLTSDQNDTMLAEKKLEKKYFLLRSFTGAIAVVILIANGYFLCAMYGQGLIDTGGFSLVLMLNRSVMDFLWKFDQFFSNASEYYGSICQAVDTMMSGESIDDTQSLPDLQITKGSIDFSHVDFGYSYGQKLFRNLSVHIAAGEKVGIVGYSGSGKTTFVHLLLRLYDVHSGTISIDGQDISGVNIQSLYDQITLVTQDTSLFQRSIKDNVRYAHIAMTDEDIDLALKMACSHDFVHVLQNAGDTLIGEDGVQLSGGQRQRIGLARAMARNCSILILDESTSQLDAVTESRIQSHLWNFFQEKTVLVIAHRLSTLQRMDRILVFDQGCIVEQGTHDALLELKGTYHQFWQHQKDGSTLNDPLE